MAILSYSSKYISSLKWMYMQIHHAKYYKFLLNKSLLVVKNYFPSFQNSVVKFYHHCNSNFSLKIWVRRVRFGGKEGTNVSAQEIFAPKSSHVIFNVGQWNCPFFSSQFSYTCTTMESRWHLSPINGYTSGHPLLRNQL